MSVITDKAMQAKPSKAGTWIIEDGARGEGRFVGRITAAGHRAFYYRYTDSAGERVRLPIGTFDPRGDGIASFTVQQARDRARVLAGMYRNGIKDLKEHLERQRAEEEAQRAAVERAKQEAEDAAARRLTIRQLFERWRATELQPTLRADGKRGGRKDGGKYVAEQFERHVFPALADRPVAEVTKADVLALVDAQKAKGQTRTAAVILSDLRQMFTFAADRDLILVDPLASIRKARIVGVTVERERVLSEAELRQLAKAIPGAKMNGRSVAAIWLALATCMRVGELMGGVWADLLPKDPKRTAECIAELQRIGDVDGVKVGIVDLEARTWHLPDTKNQREHTIHLSGFAVKHILALRTMREALPSLDPAPWLFPARDAARPVCVKSFGKQLADRQRPADRRMSGRSLRTESLMLPDGKWTAHDLRRSGATIMASLGVSGDVVDEALNHTLESKVRRVYIKDRRIAEQREAFDKLGAWLEQHCGSAT
ncbi:MAG: tyrosine-type recombinase/integrase [Burkholderiaceae bacterium]|nr:tyrosine-type recombinase/integrase [Roseateles sp.]MBV8470219.1 tyrosine-type recombinase/integrase [Burkholderiaceae bacterium]